MGFFLKPIKKRAKSIFKGVKKAFQKVLKPFAKIFNNPAFKVIMAVASVFTLGATLMTNAGQFLGNGLLGNMATSAGEFLHGINNAVGGMISKAIEGVKTFVGVGGNAAGAAGAAGNVATVGADEAAKQIAKDQMLDQAGSKSMDLITEGVTDNADKLAGNSALNSVTNVGADQSGLISQAQSSVNPSTAGDLVKDGISTVSETAATKPGLISQLKNNVVDGNFMEAGGNLWDMGKESVNYLDKHPTAGKALMYGIGEMTKEEDPREKWLREQKRQDAERENFYSTYRPTINYGAR